LSGPSTTKPSHGWSTNEIDKYSPFFLDKQGPFTYPTSSNISSGLISFHN
jgi:hypothetical protein